MLFSETHIYYPRHTLWCHLARSHLDYSAFRGLLFFCSTDAYVKKIGNFQKSNSNDYLIVGLCEEVYRESKNQKVSNLRFGVYAKMFL